MFAKHFICRSLNPKHSQFSSAGQLPILHHSRIPQFTARTIRSSIRHNDSSRLRLQANPFENYPLNKGPIPPRNIVKAIVFTGVFSGSCYLSATVWEYENARSQMIERARRAKFPWLRRSEETRDRISQIKREISTLWNRLTPGEKVFTPILGLNLLVFGMWRIPRLRPVMLTYFSSNPASRAVCWPMFLSTFSHYSLFHIFANMYVLHSFSNAAVLALGKEQFTAVYLSAGVVASFSSILVKTLSSNPGLSIGASGAIMAVLAFVCTQFPDTQLSVIFLPMFTFSAGAAIKVIMGLDLAGVLLGWKFFDHAAHLGGATFGVFWAYCGHDLWQRRTKFLSAYHDWRRSNH